MAGALPDKYYEGAEVVTHRRRVCHSAANLTTRVAAPALPSRRMRVVELWRYPVKSIGGEQIDAVDVTSLGLHGDRSWGVVDRSTGNVLTARREPKLLMATARLNGDDVVITTSDGKRMSTSDDLSHWLDRDVALTRAGDAGGTYENPLDVEGESDWVSWTGPGGAWHDSARTRVSLVSTTTLDGHDRRRFRANVIVDGSGEDDLVGSELELGEVVVDVGKQIDRCVMVTRPQPGLDRDLGVFKWVNHARGGFLGVGSLVVTPGRIAVGDTVTRRV